MAEKKHNTKPTTAEKRAAVDRMARRFAEHGRGRVTHDQAMDRARDIAKRYDRDKG